MILRTRIWLGLIVLTLLGTQRVLAEEEDYGGKGGGSDDIYDPAQLESEIETEQHRNSLEESAQEEPQTSTVRPTEAAATSTVVPTEKDENTAAEVMEDAPTQQLETKVKMPSQKSEEYYYEETPTEEEEEQHEEQIGTSTTRSVTTLIPEYVRKAKAERFPQKEDSSDYLEESSQEQVTQSQETEQPKPPQAQTQELPSDAQPKPFKAAAASDEYYYEDTEHLPTKTTTTTSTEAPLPILRARFGGFPWTTSMPTAPPTITTSSTTSTTTPTPRKQPKHIHVGGGSKPELLPADQLRNYIKDVYIRMPLAVIVDPSPASLEQAKRLYIDALQDKNINIKIVLVTLNAGGAPSAFSFNNTQEFIAGLNSTKEHEGGDAFVGILHAAELVPYDSAVFISTASISPHTELVQDAAITLLKKRIRLFLLWYGERSATENETEEALGGILGEVAIRSGGEIIHIVSTEHGQHIAGNTLTLVADAFEGAQELDLPVDTTLSSLHVRIDANMRRATMETPNGG